MRFQVADQTVYPEVIEAKLSQHTGIEAAVVFACPDAKRGAVIVAVVAAGSGALAERSSSLGLAIICRCGRARPNMS